MSVSLDPSSLLDVAIAEHLVVIQKLSSQKSVLERVASEMARAIRAGKKVLWCGNGGSAADSQHLAAELVGRFRRPRRALASIALTTDTSILTAVGNDYGYEQVFRRQVEALCLEGDVVVGISTSGSSKNVCLALEAARELDAFTVAFTGEAGGDISHIAHTTLCVSSKDTARIQEAHILLGHVLCDWIELNVCDRQIPEIHETFRV